MTTTTVDTQVIAAGSGGTSTPVKLTLQSSTEAVALQLKSVTVRSLTPGVGRLTGKNVTLFWAFSPEDLTLANVPTLLSHCVKSRVLKVDPQIEQAGQREQVRDKTQGQYLYVWFEYPASVDQYTVTIYATEFDYGTLGVGGATVSALNPLPVENTVTLDASGLAKVRYGTSDLVLGTPKAIKSTAGKLFGVRAHSAAANVLPTYLKFFNVAAAGVTPGTTVPVCVLEVPAYDAPNTGQLIIVPGPLEVESFSTAMSMLATSVLADSGAQTDPTAGLIVELSIR